MTPSGRRQMRTVQRRATNSPVVPRSSRRDDGRAQDSRDGGLAKGDKAMAWQLSGRSIEFCNCKMLCPCWLGPEGEPDQGWCGGALGFDIQRGSSDGVDLSGTKVALATEFPGNFFAGKGTARLYIGDSATTEQRRELEAILLGKK